MPFKIFSTSLTQHKLRFTRYASRNWWRRRELHPRLQAPLVEPLHAQPLGVASSPTGLVARRSATSSRGLAPPTRALGGASLGCHARLTGIGRTRRYLLTRQRLERHCQ